jgi:hypothetical protein
MKRWLLIVIGVIIIVSAGAAIRSHIESQTHIKSQAEEKREAVYESILQVHSQTLRPGLTRKEVEDRLRAKGTYFAQMCCIIERSAPADLVKIGEEDHPWYCSEHWVHIAFEYAALVPHDSLEAFDTDTLKTITIFHQLGGCL